MITNNGSEFSGCPLMATGAKSAPTGIPSLGCGEEGTLLSANNSVVTQQGCEIRMAVRWPRDPQAPFSWAALLHESPLHSAPGTQLL